MTKFSRIEWNRGAWKKERKLSHFHLDQNQFKHPVTLSSSVNGSISTTTINNLFIFSFFFVFLCSYVFFQCLSLDFFFHLFLEKYFREKFGKTGIGIFILIGFATMNRSMCFTHMANRTNLSIFRVFVFILQDIPFMITNALKTR